MIEVYLIRHGIARDRDQHTTDEERPLTPKGQEKTQKVAQQLKEIGLRFDQILTSPLIRAQQTAQILQQVRLGDTVQEFFPLAPGGKIQDWLDTLESFRGQTLALVGHQPDLGNWAELLVWGEIAGQIVVKKAGVVGLRLPDTEPLGKSELTVLISPKWLISA
jgi:phosphohistidine phosphatase